MDISYSFAADTAKLLPGIQQRADKKHVWDKYSSISNLINVYPQFLDRMKKYITEIINYIQST